MRPPKKNIGSGAQEEAPLDVQSGKVIMSKAARRKLKKAQIVVTAEMREKHREELRELRKHLRMVKSNGGRRKMAKLIEKRTREEEDAAMGFDEDARPRKKGRRLESNEWIPPVQTLPDSMLPKSITSAESSVAPTRVPPMPAKGPQLTVPNPIQLAPLSANEETEQAAGFIARPRPTASTQRTGGPKKRPLTDDLW